MPGSPLDDAAPVRLKVPPPILTSYRSFLFLFHICLSLFLLVKANHVVKITRNLFFVFSYFKAAFCFCFIRLQKGLSSPHKRIAAAASHKCPLPLCHIMLYDFKKSRSGKRCLPYVKTEGIFSKKTESAYISVRKPCSIKIRFYCR